MHKNQENAKKLLEEMLNILRVLRGEEGCPWDKKQNHESLKTYLLEESYEVLEAIDEKKSTLLKEELGDLLLQIFFHAQIASEKNEFDFADILQVLIEKMKRRHPHVFANEKIKDSEEVSRRWEEIKTQEKIAKKNNENCEKESSILADIPKALPALQKAYKIGKKVATVGFDWPQIEGVIEKVEEEFQELKEALKNGQGMDIQEELGDVFFTLANFARHLQLNPEEVLQQSCQKFSKRFQFVEEKMKQYDKKSINLDKLTELWIEAKKSTETV
ncbi:MAG: nucleoside triphosphate pyrophosphohydrolase [Deltaproteobacteria bacterium]|nr:nucleoside triphosphate pyrophosphohydrolase [Deltaproteobacteria bacterium]